MNKTTVLLGTLIVVVLVLWQLDPMDFREAGDLVETVPIGNPGNAADETGRGAVASVYRMGVYEVTNEQYLAFLEAVGSPDTNGLHNPGMSIEFDLMSGEYRTTKPDAPVTHVSWEDAARFANWLHNGRPSGAQDDTTTEDGVYDMDAKTIVRKIPQGGNWIIWCLPTHDEWYKAAYHRNDGVTGNYWNFPTGSDDPPQPEYPEMNPPSANYASVKHGPEKTSGPVDVGSYGNSASAYGTFDQGGNVWEWVDPGEGVARVVGGSYESDETYLDAHGVSWAPDLDTENDTLGFRVMTMRHGPVAQGGLGTQ
jgi:formylglycine-generating enzyme required for sulfatase activity